MACNRTHPRVRRVTQFALLLLATATCSAAPPQWIELGNQPFAATAGDDGTTFVIENHDHPGLRAIAPDGAVRWSRELPALEQSWYRSPQLVHMRLRDGSRAVCAAVALDFDFGVDILPPPPPYWESVLCFAASDGAPLANALTQVTDRDSVPFGGLQPLSDGSIVAYGAGIEGIAPPRPVAYVVDPLATAPATRIPIDVTNGRVLAVGTDGRLLVSGAIDTQAPAIRLVARDGSVLASAAFDAGDVPIAGAFLPDGDALVFTGPNATSRTVYAASRHAPDGTRRWRNITGSSYLPISVATRGGFLWTSDTVGAFGQRSAHLARHTPAGVGFRFIDSTFQSSLVLVGTTDDARLVLAGAYRNGVVVHVMDPVTWRLVAGIDLPCGARECAVQSAELGADGRLLVALSRITDSSRQPNTVLRLDVPAPPTRGAASGQLALEGAWYSPHRPYQGMVLDYVPRSDTLFGLYYLGGNRVDLDPQFLDWYSLQGTAGNGPEPPLTTYESDGGSFAVPPRAVTSASRYMRMDLQFQDCDHATLLMLGGEQRVVSLQRLTRRNAGACREGGTTAVAADAAPRAIEGSWFDPATAGQGLSIAVDRAVPPAAESMFAGWFTYDVAGTSGFTIARHWFSIQGPVPAIGGRVDATIYQSLGGLDDVTGNDTRVVGTAELTLAACDRLELRYRFNDSADARTFAGLAGTQVLTRIGGCD